MQGTFPLSFDGIVRLAKKYGVKLTPGATVSRFYVDNCGCALTTPAVANNLTTTYEVRDVIELESDPDFRIKVIAIEDGFEGWVGRAVRYRVPSNKLALYNRYMGVGQRLREYALANEGS